MNEKEEIEKLKKEVKEFKRLQEEQKILKDINNEKWKSCRLIIYAFLIPLIITIPLFYESIGRLVWPEPLWEFSFVLSIILLLWNIIYFICHSIKLIKKNKKLFVFFTSILFILSSLIIQGCLYTYSEWLDCFTLKVWLEQVGWLS